MAHKQATDGILVSAARRPIEGGPTYGFRHRAFRAIWSLTWTAFVSWTPRSFYRWRIGVLRFFGARVGAGLTFSPVRKSGIRQILRSRIMRSSRTASRFIIWRLSLCAAEA